jgi:inorganic pyrophosphatase
VQQTDVMVFVEIPAGSRNKYEWDGDAGGIVLDRRLFTSMSKIICVSLRDPAFRHITDVHDIQSEFRDEIEHFFQVYKDLEAKKTETRGFGNRAEAERVIAEARERAVALRDGA